MKSVVVARDDSSVFGFIVDLYFKAKLESDVCGKLHSSVFRFVVDWSVQIVGSVVCTISVSCVAVAIDVCTLSLKYRILLNEAVFIIYLYIQNI